MNHFLEQSIEYAQQRSYLDDLYRVYPTIPNGIREINPKEWNNVEVAFNEMDNVKYYKRCSSSNYSLLRIAMWPF